MPQFRRGGGSPPVASRPGSDRTLELLVIEGPDAGSQFTIDGEEIAVGRGATQKGRTGAIALRDPTVSPKQATIRVGESAVTLEHRHGATNPTLLNGHVVEEPTVIQVGDRIQMGHTVFELRSRPGISLSGLLAIPKAVADTTREDVVTSDAVTTEIRQALPPPAELTLVRGIRGQEGQRFPLVAITTRLGRHPANDVVLPEQGVSRYHAELEWAAGRLYLVHKSGTNPSYVDGQRVEGRAPLRSGQTIQLADRVALRIEFPEPAEKPSTLVPDERPGRRGGAPAERVPAASARSAESERSLQELMEEKIRRDEAIERDFAFNGSFLDLDVVDSHGLKVQARRPEHIIVSFERFRSFAQSVVEEHEGQVLNSNGDELMCFFDEALDAVRAATAVLDRLAEFNGRQNLLERPFRVRQGIHTGRSLLDRVRGVAYSPVLDVAGHLQKYAPVDGLLVSAETLALLPEGLPFVSIGEVGKEKVRAYRLEESEESAPPAQTSGAPAAAAESEGPEAAPPEDPDTPED